MPGGKPLHSPGLWERELKLIKNTWVAMDNADRTLRASVVFDGVSKRFGPLLANDGITFEVERGSFHALLGENGAGKTTLMRILAGEIAPDRGAIVVDGSPRRFRSPIDARKAGIRMVHQHSILIPNLSVAENFLLDHESPGLFAKLDELAADLRARISGFGLRIDPSQPVWSLSTTERQWVEVYGALQGEPRIVILDEPTSQLSPVEGDALLERLRDLTTRGVSVLLITHKMREVFAFADVVTVLRKGKWVATMPVAEASEDTLAEMMVGAGHAAVADAAGEPSAGEPLIAARDLSCRNQQGRLTLRSVNFVLARRQVLGVAGISGNGQSELARVIAGLNRPDAGTLQLPATAIRRRYVPDDRIHVGTAPGLSVRDNLALRVFREQPYARNGLIQSAVIDRLADKQIADYQIVTPSAQAKVASLSGGNIQRVVIARELDDDPDLVVAHNPTAGLDLATSAFVRARLRQVASRGGGVLLISDDLDELLQVADRIMVLHSGRIAGTLDRPEFDRLAIAALMSGAESTGRAELA
jgi:ABC-type uncharacterized transport system ATPase subunit